MHPGRAGGMPQAHQRQESDLPNLKLNIATEWFFMYHFKGYVSKTLKKVNVKVISKNRLKNKHTVPSKSIVTVRPVSISAVDEIV